jgi:ATP-dependent helicase/DNAse subunit B
MPGRLEFFYGPDLIHLSLNFINDHQEIITSPAENLYLINNNWRVSSLKTRWLLHNPDAVALSFPFQSIGNFFTRLYEQLNIPFRRLTWFEKTLILRQILQRNQRDLLYFQYENRSLSPGIIEGLLHFIESIRLDDADETFLRETDDRLALHIIDKLQHDLQLIYSQYLKVLHNSYLDEASLLKSIVSGISAEFFKSYYPDLKNVIYEDISHFRNLHFRLFDALKDLGFNVYYLLPYARNSEIFLPKEPLFNRVKQKASHVHGYLNKRRLSDSLFRINTHRLSLDQKIQYIPAVSRLQEVELLTASIKQQIINNKIECSDIGVTGPQIQLYQPILDTVFNRHSIPSSTNTVFPLIHSELIQNVLLIFELISDNYPVRTIQKILRSHFFNYRLALKEISIIEKLQDLRVKSGKKEILDHLDFLINQFTESRDSELENNSKISSLEEFKKVLKGLFNDLTVFKRNQASEKWIQQLYKLIEKHQITRKIVAFSEQKALWIAQLNLSALESLMDSLEKWHHFRNKEKISIEEFYQTILFIVQKSTFTIKNPSKFGVQIFPFSQLDRDRFKILYVLGMEDGAFPKKESHNFVNHQYLPQRLKPYLVDENLYSEREIFLRLLHYPAETILVSYPRFDKDKPFLPSTFIREMIRISDDNLQAPELTTLLTLSDIVGYVHNEMNESGPDRKDFQENKLISELGSDDSVMNRLNYKLDVIQNRDNLNNYTLWEGNISDDPIVSSYMKEYYETASFSPTQLEQYAFCPMIYFFERILKIESPDESEIFLSPLDHGRLIHRILYRFYAENRDDKRNLPNLVNIAEQELNNILLAPGLFQDLEFEYFLGSPDITGLFATYWEYEQTALNTYTTKPLHFELSFGLPVTSSRQADPLSSEEPFQFGLDGKQYNIRGKIDRVEIADSGSLLVVDYKSGTIPSLRDMWEGQKLQLPLYLKAVHHLLKDRYPKLKMAGGAFYGLKNSANIEKKIAFVDRAHSLAGQKISKFAQLPNDVLDKNGNSVSFEQFLEAVIKYAASYIKDIRLGSFPHTSDADKCTGWDGKICEYRSLCKLNTFKQAYLSKSSPND